MIEFVDIVCDLSWGDTGKGKVSAHLARTGEYNYVARWAGGANAGHTVYFNGNKYKTHIIPSGVFCGIKSIIGPGCVVNLNSFEATYNMGSPRESRATNNPVQYPAGKGSFASLTTNPAVSWFISASTFIEYHNCPS